MVRIRDQNYREKYVDTTVQSFVLGIDTDCDDHLGV